MLHCNVMELESVLNAKKSAEIFQRVFLKSLEEQVKPNTRFQLLVKNAPKRGSRVRQTNGLESLENFSERLKRDSGAL